MQGLHSERPSHPVAGGSVGILTVANKPRVRENSDTSTSKQSIHMSTTAYAKSDHSTLARPLPGAPHKTLHTVQHVYQAQVGRFRKKSTSMTQLLEKALAEVAKLTPEAQDAIAALILEELEDEQRWDAAFAASQSQLAKLAEKVRDDIRAGRVRKMGA